MIYLWSPCIVCQYIDRLPPFWQVIDNSTTAVQLSVPTAREFANIIHQIMKGEATPEALKRVEESMYSEQLVDLIAAAHEQSI